jgi:hypothetical protein
MLPPGLLPESFEPRRSAAPWILGVVVLTSLLALLGTLLQVRRLTRERDDERKRVDELVAALKKKVEPPPPPEPAELPKPPAPSPETPVQPPPAAPAAKRTSDLRFSSSELGRDPLAERISQGLHEFRSARYAQAELQFFRAVPDSFLYLALAGLARGDWREALGFLSRAMAADPKWLHRVNPRDLFGTEAEYRRVLEGVEAQVVKDPLDSESKVLLAYLRYHDQGAAYAKALLIEVTNVKPDHEEAKRFLEALGP